MAKKKETVILREQLSPRFLQKRIADFRKKFSRLDELTVYVPIKHEAEIVELQKAYPKVVFELHDEESIIIETQK